MLIIEQVFNKCLHPPESGCWVIAVITQVFPSWSWLGKIHSVSGHGKYNGANNEIGMGVGLVIELVQGLMPITWSRTCQAWYGCPNTIPQTAQIAET
jgi:hypothetical protein